MDNKCPSQRRYPPELRDRAVRMVSELRQQDPHDDGVISRVARQLGVGKEPLRSWVKQAEVDSGGRAGTTSAEHAELIELRKEVKEPRRANDISQAAATFFGFMSTCAGSRGLARFCAAQRRCGLSTM